MKKLAVLPAVLLCCVLLMGAVGQSAPVMPSKNFYINDYANVIDQNHRDAMLSAAEELAEKTGAQVVVLTVDHLSGGDIESYSFAVAEGWGIGGEKDNGVLILVAVGDRQARIEVGYGLEGALTDIGTKRIQEEEMVPRFQQGKYSAGILAAFGRVVADVYAEYGIEAPGMIAAAAPTREPNRGLGFSTILIFAFAFIFLLRVVRTRARFRNRHISGYMYPIRKYRRGVTHDDDYSDFPPGFGGPGGPFGRGPGGGGFGGGGHGGGNSGGGGHFGGGGSSSKW